MMTLCPSAWVAQAGLPENIRRVMKRCLRVATDPVVGTLHGGELTRWPWMSQASDMRLEGKISDTFVNRRL